jgi:hypothetical protein
MSKEERALAKVRELEHTAVFTEKGLDLQMCSAFLPCLRQCRGVSKEEARLHEMIMRLHDQSVRKVNADSQTFPKLSR